MSTPRQDSEAEFALDYPGATPLPTLRPIRTAESNAKRLWRRAYFLLKAKRAITRINEDVILYGTTELKDDTNSTFYQFLYRNAQKVRTYRSLLKTESKREIKKPLLLHPEGGFKKTWDLLMSLLLLYTGVFTPYLVAFVDAEFWDLWVVFDLCVNFLFSCDIIVTFFSAYVTSEGEMEVNRLTIAWTYLKGWFLIDFVACLPFSLVDYFAPDSQGPSGNYNRLIRIARLPRLYKLLRLARIIKAAKMSNSEVMDKMQDYLNINSRIYKLIRFLLLVAACVHLMGCLWFFSSKVDSGNVSSWVIRYHFQDEDNVTLYLRSIYWAVATILTVGYGDISAYTMFEQLMAIIWMVFGVGFYSYTVGSLSSFLLSIDTRETILAAKMAAAQEFSKQVGLNSLLKEKVRGAVRFHSWKSARHWNDRHDIFCELPVSLQYEVAVKMYAGLVKDLPFFSERNKHFAIFFMPLLKPMKLGEDEKLYLENDYADNVYFIMKGKLDLVLLPHKIVYKSYVRRSYLGEVEVLFHIPRIDTAVNGFSNTELLCVEKKMFWETMLEFPEEARDIAVIATEKYRRHREAQNNAIRYFNSLPKSRYSENIKEKLPIEIPLDIEKRHLMLRLQGIESEVKTLRSELQQAQVALQDLAVTWRRSNVVTPLV